MASGEQRSNKEKKKPKKDKPKASGVTSPFAVKSASGGKDKPKSKS